MENKMDACKQIQQLQATVQEKDDDSLEQGDGGRDEKNITYSKSV